MDAGAETTGDVSVGQDAELRAVSSAPNRMPLLAGGAVAAAVGDAVESARETSRVAFDRDRGQSPAAAATRAPLRPVENEPRSQQATREPPSVAAEAGSDTKDGDDPLLKLSSAGNAENETPAELRSAVATEPAVCGGRTAGDEVSERVLAEGGVTSHLATGLAEQACFRVPISEPQRSAPFSRKRARVDSEKFNPPSLVGEEARLRQYEEIEATQANYEKQIQQELQKAEARLSERFGSSLLKTSQLESQLSAFQNEMKTWNTILSKIGPSLKTAEDLVSLVHEYKAKKAALLSKEQELSVDAAEKEKTIVQMQTVVHELEIQIKELQNNKNKETSKQTSNSNLRAQQAQVQARTAETAKADLEGVTGDRLDQWHWNPPWDIVDLQEGNSHAHAPTTLHQDLFNASEIERKRLQEALSAAKDEAQALEMENRRLAKQVDEYENALGRGEYNTSELRVLELIDNPSNADCKMRREELSKLQAENRQLREQLKLWSTSRAPSAADIADKSVRAIPPRESFAVLEMEAAGLRRELAEKDKRVLRLKEVCNAKIQEVREAVHSLFSYRLDILSSGSVRLRPSFAPSPGDHFIFRSGERDSGTLAVVGWEDVPEVDALQALWVTERGSIPAFLASLVLAIGQGTDIVGVGGET